MASTSSSGFTAVKQNALYQQHLDKLYCDVIIKINKEEFFVHGCIVAACCPKLDKFIQDNKTTQLNEPNCPSTVVELDVDAVTAESFEFILSYIYTGNLDWTQVKAESINDVLSTANWCELDQIAQDYMETKHKEEPTSNPTENDASPVETIVMVDTYPEESNSPSNSMCVLKSLAANYFESAVQNQDVLFCMFCGEEFNTEDGMLLVEHVKSHEGKSSEMVKYDKQNGKSKTTKPISKTKRKSALSVKIKYKSWLSKGRKSLICNPEEDLRNTDRDFIEEQLKHLPPGTGQNICSFCDRSYISPKTLTTHLKKCKAKPDIDSEATVDESTVCIYTSLEEAYSELTSNGDSITSKTTKGVLVSTGGYMRPYNKRGIKSSRGKRLKGKRYQTDDTGSEKKRAKYVKLWICPLCPDVIFDKKKDQTEHIKSVHGTIKRHVCEQCGKCLDGKTALALHMRIHTGERPFVCKECGRGFSERKTMEDHMRRHTGERPFLCSTCGKDFTFRQSLYRHMKFHRGLRPFGCKICGKAFVLKQNLQEHEVRHQKHDLMKCCDCPQKFANHVMLAKHQTEEHATTMAKPEETIEVSTAEEVSLEEDTSTYQVHDIIPLTLESYEG